MTEKLTILPTRAVMMARITMNFIPPQLRYAAMDLVNQVKPLPAVRLIAEEVLPQRLPPPLAAITCVTVLKHLQHARLIAAEERPPAPAMARLTAAKQTVWRSLAAHGMLRGTIVIHRAATQVSIISSHRS